ncbi:MAG: hypothetical protein LBN37_01080 [Bacteroidales bacterium]|jgi:hypothetical protein|nr:hypothetical protein [Bacteroidales bacterium]
MSKTGMVWVWTPAKLTERDKAEIKKIVEAEIEKTTKLKAAVSRTLVKAGRVYLFNLYEPFRQEGDVFTKPLIDGKYFEFPLARITIYDKSAVYSHCSLDWQRHTGEWITIDKGTLTECIQIAETNDWFKAL